jgi:ABC-type sugar transport system permease subunit
VTPAVVIVSLLTIAPLLYGLYLSFTNWSILDSATPSLEGVTAYRRVLENPEFWANLGRTLVWTIGTVIIEVVIAVPLAMLLNVRTPVTGFVTGAIMIPWITPFVVLSYAWLYLYDGQSGPLHALLETVGLVGASSPLADPRTSLLAITLISGWKGVPFLTIALLAARKGITDDVYEAAALDGAGRFRSFFGVALPLLTPTLGAMCVVLGVQAFYSFDLVWILTQGGPGSSSTILGVQLFQTFFTRASPGEAAALGTVMLVLMVVCVVPILRISSRRINR